MTIIILIGSFKYGNCLKTYLWKMVVYFDFAILILKFIGYHRNFVMKKQGCVLNDYLKKNIWFL